MPRHFDFEVRHPKHPYNVTLSVAVEDGRLICEHVGVTRRTKGKSVSSTFFRDLKIKSLMILGARSVSQATVEGLDDWNQLVAWLPERPRGWLAKDIARFPDAQRVGFEVMEPGNWSDPQPVTALKAMHQLEQSRAKRPRAPQHDVLLRDVARRYRELTTGPNPDPAPNITISKKLEYKPGYIRKLVHEARELGLLGSTSSGRAGEFKPLDKSANVLPGGTK